MADSTVADWINYVSNVTVKVWVENPETLKEPGIMGKSYTTFRVLLKSSDGVLVGVRHRFSEFDTLRGVLKTKYSPYGILVPALPEKKLFGKLDKDFLTERMQGLTLFCESIVSNPWLRYDKAWKDFMTNPGVISSDDKNISEDMLTKMLDKIIAPSDPAERTAIFKDENSQVEKQLTVVAEAARALQRSFSGMTAANEAFHSSVVGWSNVEENLQMLRGTTVEIISGTCQLRPAEKTTALVSRLGSFCAEMHANTSDLPEYSSVLLSCAIEHELARCESIKELIKFHDELYGSIESLRSKVEKMESNPNSKWDVLQENKKNLEAKRVSLQTFYKGLFFFSIPMAVKGRSDNIRRCLGAYSATLFVTGFSLHTGSATFMRDLDMNVGNTIAETSHTLDLLSLKPLYQPPEIDVPKNNTTLPADGSWIERLFHNAMRLSGVTSYEAISPAAIVMHPEDMKDESFPIVNEIENPKVEVQVEEQFSKTRPVVVNSAILDDLTGSPSKVSSKSNNDLWG